MIKKVFEKVDFYRKKLKREQDDEEIEDNEWNFDDTEALFSSWDKMVAKLRSVFKLVEKNLNKMENFRQTRAQFLEV